MAKRAKTSAKFCTMAEYARHQGVSRTTPYGDWSIHGLLVRRNDGLVDVEASDHNLERDRAVSGRPWRATRRAIREAAAADE